MTLSGGRVFWLALFSVLLPFSVLQAGVTPNFGTTDTRATFIVQGQGDGEALWDLMAGNSGTKILDSFDQRLFITCRKFVANAPVVCRISIEKGVNSRILPLEKRAIWEVNGYLAEEEMLPHFKVRAHEKFHFVSEDHFMNLEISKDQFSLRFGFED